MIRNVLTCQDCCDRATKSGARVSPCYSVKLFSFPHDCEICFGDLTGITTRHMFFANPEKIEDIPRSSDLSRG